jgi:hypothetical protein
VRAIDPVMVVVVLDEAVGIRIDQLRDRHSRLLPVLAGVCAPRGWIKATQVSTMRLDLGSHRLPGRVTSN